MIKKILLILFTIITPTIIHAQNMFPLLTITDCSSTQEVGLLMLTEFEATPLFTGVGQITIMDQEGQLALSEGFLTAWVNQDIGIFGFTISYEDNISCIVLTGSNFEPFSQ